MVASRPNRESMTADLQDAMNPGEEHAQLLAFLYACPVGLLEMAADGAISMINPMAMQLLLRLHPMPSLNFFQLTEGCAPELRNLQAAFTARQGAVCSNHRIMTHVRHSGETEYEVISCTMVKLGPERFIVVLNDISAQVRLERKLHVAESWFASLLEGSQEFGVVSLDKNGNIASVSESISQQTGFDQAEMLGKNLHFLEDSSTASDELGADRQLALAAREGWHLHESWHRHKDGSRVWYQRLVAVRHSPEERDEGDGANGYTVILREGKPRSVDMHKLQHMLTRDHLTGAYNRTYFFEALEKECARKRRYGQAVSLVMIDVDFFKKVNDVHGHAAGDRVLSEFAKQCMAMLRPVDTMARMGGEEFAVLMPSTDLHGAAQMAERLRLAVAAMTVQLPSATLHLTASFGCSELDGSCDVTSVLAIADKALYAAKRGGRNKVVALGSSASFESSEPPGSREEPE